MSYADPPGIHPAGEAEGRESPAHATVTERLSWVCASFWQSTLSWATEADPRVHTRVERWQWI